MPDKSKEKDNLCTACPDCCSHHKNTPRSESSNRQLQNRLNRMIGQLNGIKKMLATIVTAEISSPRSLPWKARCRALATSYSRITWKPVWWRKSKTETFRL